MFVYRSLQTTLSSSRRSFTSTTSQARVALVTGAAQGIGKAIALRLARDGFDVAINDLPTGEPKLQEVAASILQLGRRASVCQADISINEDVLGLVQHTTEKLGSIDVMVANAGICLVKSVCNTTVDEWDRVFTTNARGVFLCYKYAAEQMLKQGRGGRIIGASSIAGKAGIPGLSAYSASKFAVRGLTQSLAQELAPYGITVNAFAPGLIQTDMVTYVRSIPVDTGSNFRDLMNPISALGIDGEPEDVAGLVSYFASAESRHLTGQTVTIDGGCVYD